MSDSSRPSGLDKVFELRTIVAILFGVYAVFCLIWGFLFTTPDEIRRAAGININLMMGVVMLLTSIGFSLWVVLRPVEQERSAEAEGQESPQV